MNLNGQQHQEQQLDPAGLAAWVVHLAKTAYVPSLLLTVDQTAAALALSPRALWGLTQPRGSLPCIEIPGRGTGPRAIRYSVRALLAWIDQQEKLSTEARQSRPPRPRPGR